MDQIQMWAEEGRICIQLMSAVEKWTKCRRISPESALGIAALLMRSGHLPNTMCITGDPEIWCQVTGETDWCGQHQAYISIQAWGYLGDRDLVAYLQGDTIAEIGRCLHQLCMEVMHPEETDGETSIFTRKVHSIFLFAAPGEVSDIYDLSSVDPEHP